MPTSGNTDKTEAYLTDSYAQLDPDYPALRRFQQEICDVMAQCGISTEHSLLDVGCGRGYLLRELEQRGYHKLAGLDPCVGLVSMAVSPHVSEGGFFAPHIAEQSVDGLICCHTLHHLEPSFPLKELQWSRQIASRWVIVVEVNNTNIPTYFMGRFKKQTEPHVSVYNRAYVEKLMRAAGMEVEYSANLRCGYLSGGSFPHAVAAALGTRPYCVVIGKTR